MFHFMDKEIELSDFINDGNIYFDFLSHYKSKQ